MNPLKGILMALFGIGCASADPAQAHQWVDEGATLLDVRTAQEFQGGHVRGALNVPIGELAGRVDEVEGDKVVVYCRSGVRSARAARLLSSAGKEVLDIGGMGNWGKPEDIVR